MAEKRLPDMKRFVDVRWVLLATMVPLLVLGLYALAIQIHGLVRYDPAFFTDEYIEQYGTPGSVARALEGALQNDDRPLLAELQGRQRPARFYTSPSMIFVMMWERTDQFFTYLYFDMQTFERHTYHFEEVNGRYVAMQSDAYFYLHSGRWLLVFLPIAITWWVIEIVAVLALLLYRISARLREQMYGE